jgi:hypothetical protein
MKQKDVALILVIAFVSAVVSLFVSRFIFASPANRQQKVDVVEAINSNFPQPDSQYFNSNSIDPTQLIQIGNTTNPNPFNGKSQP